MVRRATILDFYTGLIPKLAILALAILLVFGTTSAEVITVCKNGCSYNSINGAIDAISPGDVIEVLSGTYYENVNVTKQISLVGADTGEGMPIVDARGKGNAITLLTDGIHLEGFNITNSLDIWTDSLVGIKIASNNSIIKNNMATNNRNGIMIYFANNSTIQGNNFTHNVNGIKMEDSINNSVKENNFNSNNCGIRLLNSGNNMITGNSISDNDFGIALNQSFGNNISKNNISSNDISVLYDIYSYGNNMFRDNLMTYNLKDEELIVAETVDPTTMENMTFKEIILEPGTPLEEGESFSREDFEEELANSNQNITTVCTNGCNFISINEAIDASRPGDIIEVQSGTYYENVNITKRLILRGIDTGNGIPTVDAGYKGNAIILSAEGIILEGFNTTNSLDIWGLRIWAGIKVTSNNSSIIANIATNNENGILLIEVENNSLERNNASLNIYGIKLKNSVNNTITTNELNRNNYGIYLNSSDKNAIAGNSANDNDFGIILNSSVNNRLSGNLMYENSYNFGADGINDINISNFVDTKQVYYLVGSHDNAINSSSNAGTIYCINCDNVTVIDLTLTNNTNGIYFYNCTNSWIANNSLTNSVYGINLTYSANNSIIDNNAFENQDCIVLYKSGNNNIQGNNIQDSVNHGICLSESGNNTILDNYVSNSRNGISLFESRGNQVFLNNLSNSSAGIRIKYSWMNNITINNIKNNDNGIILEYCIENSVSGNNVSYNQIGILYDTFSEKNNTINNTLINNQKPVDKFIPATVGSSPWSGSSSSSLSDETTKAYMGDDRNGASRHPYVFVDEAKSIEEYVESYLKELPSGYVIFNPPEKMNRSQSYTIEALIPRNYSGDLIQELEGTGTPKRYNITKLGPEMAAQLSGPKFEIYPEEEITQHIEEGDYCKWTWIVTPLENGTQTLLLTIKVLVRLPPDYKTEGVKQHSYTRGVEVLSQEFEVDVGLAQQFGDFVQHNWQFLLTVIIIPLIGWLVKRKFGSYQK